MLDDVVHGASRQVKDVAEAGQVVGRERCGFTCTYLVDGGGGVDGRGVVDGRGCIDGGGVVRGGVRGGLDLRRWGGYGARMRSGCARGSGKRARGGVSSRGERTSSSRASSTAFSTAGSTRTGSAAVERVERVVAAGDMMICGGGLAGKVDGRRALEE